MRVRIKICCIGSVEETALAISAGADAIGLVSRMPSGPGPIDESPLAKIARILPPPIASFLITCETSADSVIAQARRCGCNTLQLCDSVDPSAHPTRDQLCPASASFR